MAYETVFLILGFLGFVLLLYSLIALVKRKEYENDRILIGYNVFLFGIFLLSLSFLIRTLKYAYLVFQDKLAFLNVIEGLIYFDVVSKFILMPIVAGSFLVGMLMFRQL